MTERIKLMRSFIRKNNHHQYRREVTYQSTELLEKEHIPHMERVTLALEAVLEHEQPLVFENEKILFWRTVKNLPDILTEREWADIRANYFIHELGRISNLSPDYAPVLDSGLLPIKAQMEMLLKDADNDEKKMFYSCVIRSIDAVLKLVERYRDEALAKGNTNMAAILERVPARGARNFHEALQSLRIIHYTLWCEGEYHNTLGRFDQYMWPYLSADLNSGSLSADDALELVEEFFLSLNRDSDLYPGIQQGDNGQSMMLGGVDAKGESCFNKLSEMCLDASRELKLIDPKINLRVDKNTPLWVYEKGTQLTKEGLGFPQYSNDDVVIPGLVAKGYDLNDARNYAVAACWEFIIPGAGADIPNVAAVNFPRLVSDAVTYDLASAKSYDEFFSSVEKRLDKKCREMCEKASNLYFVPAPFISILMHGCLEQGQDISHGGKYNNYGFHGVGISTAVDSLLAVKQLIFEQKKLTVDDAKNFIMDSENHSELFSCLRYELPKFGDDDDGVDGIAVELMNSFANAVEPLRNDRGGCVRAGTGSAMFYLWYADNIGSALSGHMRGDAFSANYAPELFVRSKGPLSVILSFTKPNLTRTINGGPLTMEFHSSIFRDEDSAHKVASLVRAFVQNGGHQLQLNSVNKETMLDAQKNPDEYKNLIVRIWGWSAYFVELDREYQDHVIARQEFLV